MEKQQSHTAQPKLLLKPILLKNSSLQPKHHTVYIGCNLVKKNIRYLCDYKIIDRHILFQDNSYYGQLLDFIIDQKYKLILGDFHLYLADNSEWVYGAGRIKINTKGYIYYIDNWSGHYQPSAKEFESICEYLKQNLTVSVTACFQHTNTYYSFK